MRLIRCAAIAALAAAAAACGQGGSDNVMSPEANALEPAQVDTMLGPENMAAGNQLDANSANGVTNGLSSGAPSNESAANNAAE